MDFGTHILIGIVIGLAAGGGYNILWALLGAAIPDVIGEPFYYLGRLKHEGRIRIRYDKSHTESYEVLGNSPFLYPYYFLHSLLFLAILFILPIPKLVFISCSAHIAIDVFSHAKTSGGLKLFWPFSKKKFGVSKNWWEWKLMKKGRFVYLNIIAYIILYLIFRSL